MSRRSTPADDGPKSRAGRTTRAAEPFGALLTRVAGGDRDAFATVYDRVGPTLFRLARSRGFPSAESEVLVEHVLLQVWLAAPAYARRPGPASDWMRRLIDDALQERAAGH